MTKGSSIEAPWHLSQQAGHVVLTAEFAPNLLFYAQINNEDSLFLSGSFWYGEAKWSKTNDICRLIPKSCQEIHKEIIGGTTCGHFVAEADVPFLSNSPAKLLRVTVGTKEQRFVTKIVKVSVLIPDSHWAEWKMYHLRLWQAAKSAIATDK